MMTEVKWCVVTYGHLGLESTQPEPEPLFNYLKEQYKKLNYDGLPRHLKCYAFMDYCKNSFVIKSPVDVIITVGRNPPSLKLDRLDQDFYDNFFMLRDEDYFGKNKFGITTMPKLLFFSDKSVKMESIPFYFLPEINPIHNKIAFVSGVYDIGKWIRPIDVSGEIISGVTEIKIKHNDPLFVVRFSSRDQEIKLKRVYEDEKILRAMRTCTDVKRYKTFIPLNKLYDSLDGLLRNLGFKKDI